MSVNINVHRIPMPEGVEDSSDFTYAYGEENKLKKVGSGLFARVYSTKGKPKGNVVCKVAAIPNEYDGWEADGYMTYLCNVVLPNQGNPFVPTILTVDVFELLNSKGEPKNKWGEYEATVVVQMERLFPWRHIKGYDTRQEYLNAAGLRSIYAFARPENITSQHIKALADGLKHLFKNHHNDIHEGNVMWRRMGETYHPVLTDPVT